MGQLGNHMFFQPTTTFWLVEGGTDVAQCHTSSYYITSDGFNGLLAKFYPIFWCGSPLYDENWRFLKRTKPITFNISLFAFKPGVLKNLEFLENLQFLKLRVFKTVEFWKTFSFWETKSFQKPWVCKNVEFWKPWLFDKARVFKNSKLLIDSIGY